MTIPWLLEILHQLSHRHLITYTHPLLYRLLRLLKLRSHPLCEIITELLSPLNRLHGRYRKQIVSLLHLLYPHLQLQLHPRDRLAQPDHRLQLPHCDRYGALPIPHLSLHLSRLSILDIDMLELLRSVQRQPGMDLISGVLDVLLHGLERNTALHRLSWLPLMKIKNMVRNSLVSFRGVDVLHYENTVESRQDGILQLNLLLHSLQVVQPAVYRIGRSENRGPWVQSGGNTRLSHTNSLLFHGLVDRHPVSRLHLVELVYTDNTSIGQHQSSSLDLKLPRGRVLTYSRS